jgi:hypothetical protein
VEREVGFGFPGRTELDDAQDAYGSPRARPEAGIEAQNQIAFARLLRELSLNIDPIDLVFWQTANEVLARGALWLLRLGLIIAALAASIGFLGNFFLAEENDRGARWLRKQGPPRWPRIARSLP